jgi:hypothetical protein
MCSGVTVSLIGTISPVTGASWDITYFTAPANVTGASTVYDFTVERAFGITVDAGPARITLTVLATHRVHLSIDTWFFTSRSKPVIETSES